MPLKAEIKGEAVIAGITVQGRADRIDRLADGGLAIIDYKTGAPPIAEARSKAGFALQLGLLGLIGRAGGFEGVAGDPECFRILVADAPQRRVRQADVPRQDHAAGRIPGAGAQQFRCGCGQLAERHRAVHGQAQPGLCALRRI